MQFTALILFNSPLQSLPRSGGAFFFSPEKNRLIPVPASALRVASYLVLRGELIPVVAAALRVAQHGTLARGQCGLL